MHSSKKIFTLTAMLFFPNLVDLFCIPDILWFPLSPMFDHHKCGAESRKFFANLNDVIPFLCANEDLNNGFVMKNSLKRQYNYNIYMTENENDYLSRNATNAILLKECKQKTSVVDGSNKVDVVVVKHMETLSQFDPMGGHTYVPGKRYFFFTTSDGTLASLANVIGKNDSIGFEVRVCDRNDNNCTPTNRVTLCVPKLKLEKSNGGPVVVAQKRIENSDVVNDKKFTQQPSMLYLCIGLAFVVGLLVGICAVVVYKKRQFKRLVNARENVETPLHKEDDRKEETVDEMNDKIAFESQTSTTELINNKM